MSDAFGTNSVRQAALLIDADNFADPKAIDAAWAEFNAYAGRVSVCRAYGYGPRLQSLGSVWRYLGTRTFPNLPLEKNTTDSALIADAVALHFQQGVRLFAIASGDADFAPLAVRLREWGCEVWCFSMEGIVFRDAETYYDRVVQFCPPQPQPQPQPQPPLPVAPVVAVKQSVAPRAPEETPTMPVFSVMPGAEKSLNPTPQLPKPASKPASPPVPHSDVLLPDAVLLILKALPGLREGPQHLSQAAATLRQQGILGKTVKSTHFLAPYAAYFKLSPAQQPNRLEFMAPLSKMGAVSAVGAAQLPSPAPVKADAQTLKRILAAFPGWLPDTVRQLSLMDILLQESGIQTGGKRLPELFAIWPDHFKLLPLGDLPQKVRLLKKPEGLEFAC